ncbi:PREDICTED: interleukin-1 receptor-like 1 [Condylura cristata]|uniref:interleukin-1 receptor-like 1 n=1 Tax=Condylura cristata TaxID=143302 RepID=UPI0003343C25|nr:PREDICTED: interleukin-1 receptor-like 1 [Condylura cristata]
MTLWILAFLIVLNHSKAALFCKYCWGLENEALIVKCPSQDASQYPVDWYYSKTNRRVTTEKTNRIFASGEYLKFLPSEVNDTGIYACVVRSTSNKTRYMNITIHKKQPDCHIPDELMYVEISGSEKNSRISCPTINNYNWKTAPIEWFKNCKALRGSRYHTHEFYLVIEDVTSRDAGDYTCKFVHNENGVNYSVTATRPFIVKDPEGFSLFPVIIAPPQNGTQEVDIGRTVNITCSACFGKGPQFVMNVRWSVNERVVGDSGEARFQEKKEQNQSSSNNLTCISTVLIITDVKEEDLLQKFECLAMNLHGLRKHNIRLRRKNPSKDCF